MAADDVKRKLTAIFSADVVSYSRLMSDNEVNTVQTLTSHKETLSKLIKHYRGRVVDSIGDNLMAEFASVVDAVQCAVEVQQVLSSKNEDLPENRKMFFRIGINLGDVIEEGDCIYGDGVNIAARIESLADAGGICISGSAFEQIENKLALGYQYMGEHEVKNIAKPIRVYKVPMGPVEVSKKKNKIRGWQKITIPAVTILFLAVTAALVWNFYFRPPPMELALKEKVAYQLPDKPSIAVLPFTNISNDPKQDYIARGITENIISALSQNSEMFVISRNATFIYKEASADLSQVSNELGVRHVLKGSIQKSGDHIRVHTLLVDATTAHNLWSERYDRKMEDFFVVQDEITQKVAIALQIKLTHGERTRSYMTTQNLEAWECTVKGNHYFTRFTNPDNAKAREFFRRAIELDPGYAFAWSLLAWTHFIDVWFEFTKLPEESLKQAFEIAYQTLTLDQTIPDVHSLLGCIYLMQRKYDQAIAEGRKALALSPNDATSLMLLAQTLCYAGITDEGISMAKKAVRHSPHVPAWYLAVLGLSYYTAGLYEESLVAYKQLFKRSKSGEIPPVWAHIGLVSVYTQLGQEKQASVHTAELLKLDPTFSLNWVRKIMLFKEPSHLDRILNALRRAGLK